MPKQKMDQAEWIRPWWLGGEETCPVCGQRFVYESRLYCVACDGPLCPHCVERTTELEVFCPRCFSEMSDQ
jgi:hypothetical protein